MIWQQAKVTWTDKQIIGRNEYKIFNQKYALTSITDIYEEVRYGVRYPEDNELKFFKKTIIEISKNLQQMQ